MGDIEETFDIQLAKKIPASVTPEILAAAGFYGAIIVFAGYSLSVFNKNYLVLSSLGFILIWLGNSLSDRVEKHRKIVKSECDVFLNRMSDVIKTTLIFFGLGLSPYVPFSTALCCLVSCLLMTVLFHAQECFKIESSKTFSSAEIHAVSTAINSIFYLTGPARIYDSIAILAAFGLWIIFLFNVFETAKGLTEKQK